MMTFGDAKIGEVILAYFIPSNKCIGYRNVSGCITIPATVIDQCSNLSTILGWKAGEKTPNNILTTSQPITDEWLRQGIIIAYHYNNECECLPYLPTAFQTPKSVEDHCKQCGKMNDMGVLQCWWCQTSYPTVK